MRVSSSPKRRQEEEEERKRLRKELGFLGWRKGVALFSLGTN